MQKTFITNSKGETQELGRLLAEELQGSKIICLEGELGAGKTTFTQGFLEGLGIEGPYTSPTFVIMKNYPLKANSYKLKAVFHMDVYRIEEQDVLDLGWEEIIAGENIVLVEWADRIKNILPQDSLRIHFKWLDENKREITFFSQIFK